MSDTTTTALDAWRAEERWRLYRPDSDWPVDLFADLDAAAAQLGVFVGARHEELAMRLLITEAAGFTAKLACGRRGCGKTMRHLTGTLGGPTGWQPALWVGWEDDGLGPQRWSTPYIAWGDASPPQLPEGFRVAIRCHPTRCGRSGAHRGSREPTDYRFRSDTLIRAYLAAYDRRSPRLVAGQDL